MGKKVLVDETQHELAKHGNFEFPLEANIEQLSAFENKAVTFHWHRYLQFSVVLSGQMEYQIDSRSFLIKEGEGFFINTNRIHGGWQHKDLDCTYVSLLFDPRMIYGFESSAIALKYVEPILQSKDFNYLRLFPDEVWQSQMLDVIRRIWKLYESKKPCYELLIKGMLCQMWALMCEKRASFIDLKAVSNEKDTERLKIMLDYIHNHFQKMITLDDIAGEVGLSRSECSRFFKKMVHHTMSEYIATYRVHKSIPMVLEGKLSMTEIAGEVGFSGASYFAEMFRKYMNSSPSEYREGHGRVEDNREGEV